MTDLAQGILAIFAEAQHFGRWGGRAYQFIDWSRFHQVETPDEKRELMAFLYHHSPVFRAKAIARSRARHARYIEERDRMRPPCECCGKPMRIKRTDQRYCTAACREKAWRQRNAKKASRA